MGMAEDEMMQFLRDNVEPVSDPIYGNRYRAAARMVDGTYLPCVVFQSRAAQVELALRRFEQGRHEPAQYEDVVASFVSGSSRLWDHEVKAVETSPFAWPMGILKTIHGETTMGWTAFVVEMLDGTLHSYGKRFHWEFFELPDNYSCTDIAKIHSGMAYSAKRGLHGVSTESFDEIKFYREKPFFTCFANIPRY